MIGLSNRLENFCSFYTIYTITLRYMAQYCTILTVSRGKLLENGNKSVILSWIDRWIMIHNRCWKRPMMLHDYCNNVGIEKNGAVWWWCMRQSHTLPATPQHSNVMVRQRHRSTEIINHFFGSFNKFAYFCKNNTDNIMTDIWPLAFRLWKRWRLDCCHGYW